MKKKISKINNLVAKYSQSTGSGAHGKSAKAKRRDEKIKLRKDVYVKKDSR